MTDIFDVIDKTKEFSPKDRKEALLPIADNSSVSRIFSFLGSGKKDDRALLRALADVSSNSAVKQTVAHYAGINKDKLLGLLHSNDAKTRKLSAEFCGKILPNECACALRDALLSETTDFVKPSFILALGNITDPQSARELCAFLKAYNVSECDEKHRTEQELALKKAISSLSDDVPVNDCNIDKDSILVLDCPSADIAIKDLSEMGLTARKARFPFETLLVSGLTKYTDIFSCRSFYTASVFYGDYKNLKEAFSVLRSKAFNHFLHRLFGNNTLSFRVELKCEKGCEPENGRRQAAEEVAARLDKEDPLLNMSPSSYSFEILLRATLKGTRVSLLPSVKLDHRFDYKKESVPASIHPAAAASCISFIKSYTFADSRVIDCFCGSGTMVFERALLPHAALFGSDISPAAIRISKSNERLAQTKAKFFVKNAAEAFNEKYDEIICNMPFGLRVGSHRKNADLYRAFLVNIKHILTERGRAFLFTNDKKLLSELIEPDFKLIAKHNFSCGGLYPTLFVLEPLR